MIHCDAGIQLSRVCTAGAAPASHAEISPLANGRLPAAFAGQHLNWTAHLDLIPSRLPQRSTSSDLCTLQSHGKPDAVARIWGLPDPNLFSARSRQRRVYRRASHLDRDGDRCPGAGRCLPAFAPWQASFRHHLMASHHSPATSSHQGHVLPDLGPQVCKHEGGLLRSHCTTALGRLSKHGSPARMPCPRGTCPWIVDGQRQESREGKRQNQLPSNAQHAFLRRVQPVRPSPPRQDKTLDAVW